MTFGELRFNITRLIPGADPDVLDMAINGRIESIERHLPWKALEADSQFVAPAACMDGSVSVLQGSNGVTLTGAVWSAALTGRVFRVLARNETYVFTFVDPTHGTLDRPYEGDATSAAAYVIFQLYFPLPSDYRGPLESSNERIGQEVRYVDRKALLESTPSLNYWGEPWYWTEVSRAADGSRRALLYPAPEYAASYPFHYYRSIPRLTDTAAVIPDWISTRGLIAGVRADVEKDGSQELIFQTELSQMRAQDARARGPRVLRMAPLYTRHRIERVLRNYRRHLP